MSLQEGSRERFAEISAMASTVTIRVVEAGATDGELRTAMDAALDVFVRVDTTCTRFDGASSLMRANAAPARWHRVAPECFDALLAAYDAYERTAGRFDPRVLTDLVALGYARSFRGGTPEIVDGPPPVPRPPLPEWRPRFRRRSHRVRLGELPVDLGGIGKGLAVRWAAEALASLPGGFVVEAGGDSWCAGEAPEGGPWRVAVEDPFGGDGPIAVLAVNDRAVATSSVRLRAWRLGDIDVHHLVDPTTGRPGGEGLRAVTVVAADAADAEVHSKTLFLEGSKGIGAAALRGDVAALWVDTAGVVQVSAAMSPYLLWTAI
ncbi:MAG: hypothetical protein JWM93_972 [Frankiales bacterium]|nr:hypothetical protein [Frankiales bacterium]